MRRARTDATLSAHEQPRLLSYDVIALSSSGGKDSQAMIDHVVELAIAAGVRDRLVVVHADLGRVEWPGTLELAREQAQAYGVPFIACTRLGGVVRRGGKTYAKGERYGDILDYARRRGAWPDSQNRWCTSDFKRGPILRTFTALARQWSKENPSADRPCRILDCQGLRAEESPARAKRPRLKSRKRTRNQVIDSWLPIQDWSQEEVWAAIEASGVRYHPAYDLGMPRLSCVFCIFAPREALMIAGKANPRLLKEYVEVERSIDHTFRHGFALEEIQQALEDGVEPGEVEDGDEWNM